MPPRGDGGQVHLLYVHPDDVVLDHEEEEGVEEEDDVNSHSNNPFNVILRKVLADEENFKADFDNNADVSVDKVGMN